MPTMPCLHGRHGNCMAGTGIAQLALELHSKHWALHGSIVWTVVKQSYSLKYLETPRWPVTWVCLLVDSAIATCLLLLLTCTITNTIINDSLTLPLCALSLASSHWHHEPVTRPHVCAQAQNLTWTWLHGANPIDTRCKFSCDNEFIISSNTSKVSCHFILSSMPHPFPSTSLSSVPLRPIEDYTS